MKPTGNPQINSKIYWDYIYNTPAKEVAYWADSGRFTAVVDEVKDGDKFIDFGCGVGVPGNNILKTKKGCEVWGTDISDDVIERNKNRNPDIQYFQGYVGYQDFLPVDYFDVVFAGEIIEHIDEPNKLFEEAYRVLKKGGKLIISTPREEAIGSPEHIWEYTEEDVEKLYLDAGFTEVTFMKLPNMEHLKIIFSIGVK
jgi:ubiquinone/menaquinone biosynthesis C-methylase UbiE